MITSFLKRDIQIFKSNWQTYLPSWLFFFLVMFLLNMVKFEPSTIFFVLFFVIVLTLKDIFLSDQVYGFLGMMICEKVFLPYYILSKILSSFLFILFPLLLAIYIFSCNFNLFLPGCIVTALAIMVAGMQITKITSWLLHLVLLPFMIPIFLVINMHNSGMLETKVMFYIFLGLFLVYLPISLFLTTVCLKQGD